MVRKWAHTKCDLCFPLILTVGQEKQLMGICKGLSTLAGYFVVPFLLKGVKKHPLCTNVNSCTMQTDKALNMF